MAFYSEEFPLQPENIQIYMIANCADKMFGELIKTTIRFQKSNGAKQLCLLNSTADV